MVRILFSLLMVASLTQAQENEAFASTLSQQIYGQKQHFLKHFGKESRYHEGEGMVYALVPSAGVQWVVFRGTDELADWLVNLDTAETPFGDGSEGMVHSGFLKLAQTAVNTLPVKRESPVIVTGHSLGGAAALLAGALLYDEGYDVRVISFGAPPVGDTDFVTALETLPHIRFEHLLDPVPKADHKSMELIKGLLEEIDTETLRQEFRAVVAYLRQSDYRFVHHGEERILTHILTMDNPFSSEILMQPVRYHSMASYRLFFDEFSPDQER